MNTLGVIILAFLVFGCVALVSALYIAKYQLMKSSLNKLEDKVNGLVKTMEDIHYRSIRSSSKIDDIYHYTKARLSEMTEHQDIKNS